MPADATTVIPLLPITSVLLLMSVRVTGLVAVTVRPLRAISASEFMESDPAKARSVRYTSVEAPGMSVVKARVPPDAAVDQLEEPLIML
ncbi:MAG: hypothetical protein EBR81_17315 [Proteobacteria bacterium]|nr:hypothetical protein [Pseudomonadota bacterium]